MVPAGARCATHAEVAAVDVCQRCGKFLCGDCIELVSDDSFCADCAARVTVGASRLAKAGLITAGVSWLCFGAFALGVRSPPFTLLLVAVPGPGALAALVIALIEWRRMKAGLAPAKGRPWVIATTAVAAPLFLLALALLAFGLFILFGLIMGQRTEP